MSMAHVSNGIWDSMDEGNTGGCLGTVANK